MASCSSKRIKLFLFVNKFILKKKKTEKHRNFLTRNKSFYIYTHTHARAHTYRDRRVFKKEEWKRRKKKLVGRVEEHERDLRNPTGGCGSIRLTDDR